MASRHSHLSFLESLESRTLLSAGDRNLAFGGGDGRLLLSTPGGVAMSVAAQPDGKFVLTGTATQSGKKVLWLERLDAKGNVDKSFGSNGTVKLSIPGFVDADDIIRQPDGKFIVAGETATGGFVARFTSAGKFDATFGGGDGVATTTSLLYKVVVLPNGNIAALAGDGRAFEWKSNGSRDSSFGSNGAATFVPSLGNIYSFNPESLIATKDNKLLIVATVGLPEPYIDSAIGVVRLSTSGKLDQTFLDGGFIYDELTGNDQCAGAAIQSNGRIVIAAVDDNSNTYVIFLNPDGTFRNSVQANWSSALAEGPTNIAVDASDRIIVVGHSNPNEGSEVGYSDQEFAIQRLSSSGKIEFQKFVDFATPANGRDDYAHAVAVGADGNIIVLGTSSLADSGADEQFAITSIQANSGGPSDAVPFSISNSAITVSGTSGNDSITVTPADRGEFFIDFNGNIDHYYLGLRNVIVNGGGGNDRLAVVGKFDGNAVTLNGGSGNDTLIGDRGPEAFIGGSGNDTADYSARSDNLNITLDNVANDGAAGEKDNVSADIETILGGSGNDKLAGNPFANILKGNAGNDTLYGGAGNDTLDGGSGRDMLFGQDGNDTFLAKDGRTDTLDGGNGLDTAQRDNSSTIKDSVLSIESYI